MSHREPIVFASMIWQPNAASKHFSTMYNAAWVERLYRGFERNTTRPFEFHLWVDSFDYEFDVPVTLHKIDDDVPNYSSFIQPFELNRPMILVGLDTVITGNIDALVDYCFEADMICLPNDPFMPVRSCNGVALIPVGHAWVRETHNGENDMEWLRAHPHARIDTVFPGAVKSYKGYVREHGLTDERIVFFHGLEKPHELTGVDWIGEHWR